MDKRKFYAIICSIVLSSALCTPSQLINADELNEMPGQPAAAEMACEEMPAEMAVAQMTGEEMPAETAVTQMTGGEMPAGSAMPESDNKGMDIPTEPAVAEMAANEVSLGPSVSVNISGGAAENSVALAEEPAPTAESSQAVESLTASAQNTDDMPAAQPAAAQNDAELSVAEPAAVQIDADTPAAVQIDADTPAASQDVADTPAASQGDADMSAAEPAASTDVPEPTAARSNISSEASAIEHTDVSEAPMVEIVPASDTQDSQTSQNTFTLSLRNLIFGYSGAPDSQDTAASFELRIDKDDIPEAFSGILQDWREAGGFLTRIISLVSGGHESVEGIPDSCKVTVLPTAASTLQAGTGGSQSFSRACIVDGQYREFCQASVLNDALNRVSGHAEFSMLRFAELNDSGQLLYLINDSDIPLPMSLKVDGTGSYVIAGTDTDACPELSERQPVSIQIPARSFVYLTPAPGADANQSAQFTFTPGNVHVNAGISSLNGLNGYSYNADTGVMSLAPGAFSRNGQFAMFRVEDPRSGSSENPNLHGGNGGDDHDTQNPNDPAPGGHEPNAPGMEDTPKAGTPDPSGDVPPEVPNPDDGQPGTPSHPGSTPSSGSTPSKMKKSPKSPSNSLDHSSDTVTARAAVPEADASLSARTAPVDTADRTPADAMWAVLVISGAVMLELARQYYYRRSACSISRKYL